MERLEGQHHRAIYDVHWGSPGIVTGGADNAIRIFRASPGVANTASALASPDVHPPAPGLSSTLALAVEVRQAHNGDVNSVRWSPGDSQLLASAGDDAVIRLWRFEDPWSYPP